MRVNIIRNNKTHQQNSIILHEEIVAYRWKCHVLQTSGIIYTNIVLYYLIIKLQKEHQSMQMFPIISSKREKKILKLIITGIIQKQQHSGLKHDASWILIWIWIAACHLTTYKISRVNLIGSSIRISSKKWILLNFFYQLNLRTYILIWSTFIWNLII